MKTTRRSSSRKGAGAASGGAGRKAGGASASATKGKDPSAAKAAGTSRANKDEFTGAAPSAGRKTNGRRKSGGRKGTARASSAPAVTPAPARAEPAKASQRAAASGVFEVSEVSASPLKGPQRFDLRETLRREPAYGSMASERHLTVSGQDTAELLATGALPIEGVWVLQTPLGQGALTSHPGLGYKDGDNEDAGALGFIGKAADDDASSSLVFAGAFDQAGGMGSLENEVGAASRIAAESLPDAARAVARKGVAPVEALNQGIAKANRKIAKESADAGTRMVTTYAAFLVQGKTVHITNVGDSAVFVFSPDGSLKFATRPHNLGYEIGQATGSHEAGLFHSNIVTRALGDEEVEGDFTSLNVDDGDFIIGVSDGVTDANLPAQIDDTMRGKHWPRSHDDVTEDALGAIVRRSVSAEEVAIRVLNYALTQMGAELGKRDNVTVVSFRVG